MKQASEGTQEPVLRQRLKANLEKDWVDIGQEGSSMLDGAEKVERKRPIY